MSTKHSTIRMVLPPQMKYFMLIFFLDSALGATDASAASGQTLTEDPADLCDYFKKYITPQKNLSNSNIRMFKRWNDQLEVEKAELRKQYADLKENKFPPEEVTKYKSAFEEYTIHEKRLKHIRKCRACKFLVNRERIKKFILNGGNTTKFQSDVEAYRRAFDARKERYRNDRKRFKSLANTDAEKEPLGKSLQAERIELKELQEGLRDTEKMCTVMQRLDNQNQPPNPSTTKPRKHELTELEKLIGTHWASELSSDTRPIEEERSEV